MPPVRRSGNDAGGERRRRSEPETGTVRRREPEPGIAPRRRREPEPEAVRRRHEPAEEPEYADEAYEPDDYAEDDYDDEDEYDEGYAEVARRPAERAVARRPRLPAARAAREGRRQIVELTGRDVNGVVAVQPADDGWLVGVEVVETRRIPSSIDMLALYEVAIDDDGELLAYRRVRRYQRGKSEVS